MPKIIIEKEDEHYRIEFLYDNRKVYQFYSQEFSALLRELESKINKLEGHPLWPFENMWGRKVYFHTTPAIITRYDPVNGEVSLSCAPGIKEFAPTVHELESGQRFYRDTIHTIIFDEAIYWRREQLTDAEQEIAKKNKESGT